MTESAPPLVSVLMPVRNEECAVAAALDSVLAQTYRHLEVLVADGESDDRTRTVIEQYAARDPRVRLVSNPDRTIPAGLNTALAQARGDLVMRVDGHWAINRTYVEAGLSLLEESPDVAAVGGRRNAVAESRTGRAIACALGSKFGVGNSLYHYGTEQEETDHASGGIYRAEVVRAIKGWDEELPVNEDVDLDHRILEHGHRILFEPSMVARWQGRENLRDLRHQYRRYGRGKAQMLRKNGLSALRPRHLVAPAVVVALPVAVAAGAMGWRGPALALGAPYPAALALATLLTRRAQPEPRPDAAPLAGAFATMHLSWGLGVLEGLLWSASPAPASARTPESPETAESSQS